MVVTDWEFGQICRLCMQKGALTSIFKIDDGTELNVKAMILSSINIHHGDGLPGTICSLCERNLKEFYKFRRKCEETDGKLRSLARRIKNEIEIKLELAENSDSKAEPELCTVERAMSFHGEEVYVASDDLKMTKEQCTKSKLKTHKSKCGRVKAEKMLGESGDGHYVENIRPARPYQCEQCGRTFKLKAILNKHRLTHSGVKLYPCPLCPKQYTRSDHRVVHMRSHTGSRPFVCQICARSFTKNQDLSRHQRIHSDEKKYQCQRCDRKFKRSADVHSHMRTHTGMRPYMCKQCGRTYASHSGLRKHSRTQCKQTYVHDRATGQGLIAKSDIGNANVKICSISQQQAKASS